MAHTIQRERRLWRRDARIALGQRGVGAGRAHFPRDAADITCAAGVFSIAGTDRRVTLGTLAALAVMFPLVLDLPPPRGELVDLVFKLPDDED